jgi:hypothetical protein
MLLDPGVESADIGTVYLIRLYIATFAILAVLFTLVAAAPFTFGLPYMFQVKHITPIGWEARFQCLTVVIVSLPLLLGSIMTLVAWGGTALNLREIDALFELKKAKDEGQGSGEQQQQAEEEVDNAVQAESIISDPDPNPDPNPNAVQAENIISDPNPNPNPTPHAVQAQNIIASLEAQAKVGTLSAEGAG